MNISRRKLWLIGVLVFILIVLAISFGIYRADKSPARTETTINKDTGQTIVSYPNQTPENGGDKNYVTILGANKLLSAGMTQAQFTLTEQLITNYVNNQLHRQYTEVSILNDGFSSNGTSASGSMRLGSSNILLNLNVSFSDLTMVSVSISDPANNPIYSYQSGDLTVTSQ